MCPNPPPRSLPGHSLLEDLDAFGWRGSSKRLRELCEMMLANGLFHWTQLDLVPEPSVLVGAEIFTSEELRILSDVRGRGRELPRWRPLFVRIVGIMWTLYHILRSTRTPEKKIDVQLCEIEPGFLSGEMHFAQLACARS